MLHPSLFFYSKLKHLFKFEHSNESYVVEIINFYRDIYLYPHLRGKIFDSS